MPRSREIRVRPEVSLGFLLYAHTRAVEHVVGGRRRKEFPPENRGTQPRKNAVAALINVRRA
jgi:hypothetical protein